MTDIFARVSNRDAGPRPGAPISDRQGTGASPGPRPSRGRRKLVSTIFLIAGIVLLVFALGAYTWMSVEQHGLEAKWQAESANIASAVPTSGANKSSPADNVTLLSIPKIKLEAVILEGTTHKSLMLAPGHLKNTAWPGDAGNAVIAAHRDTFFRHIHELNKGDDIYVRRAGREYHYVVISKAIVAPDDIAVTYPTADTRLTLVTCYPTYYIGPAPKRLVVVAALQPGSGPAPAGHSAATRVSQ